MTAWMRQTSDVAPMWFVASITDSLRNQSSLTPGAAGSSGLPDPPKWFAVPYSFRTHHGAQAFLQTCRQNRPCLPGTPPCMCSISLNSDSFPRFHVRGRRHPPIQNVVIPPDLDMHGMEDLHLANAFSIQASRLATMLKNHLVPNTTFIMAAHRQALQAMERAGRWMSSRRYKHASERRRDSGRRHDPTSKAMTEEERLFQQAQQAEQQINPELAAALLSQLVALEPKAEHYAMLSKQVSDITYMPGISRSKVVEVNTKAVELAGQAVAIEPSRAEGHIARCVSRGRLALVSDNRTKVQLAKDAAEDAITALKLDPSNDLAHHLMGRWHFEMAQVNGMLRYLIRLVYGASLMQGTFQQSLVHFRTAAELSPGRVIHRVEIGRTLLKLGDPKGAVQELQQALEMEIEDINAQLQQVDAAIMLQKLQGSDQQAQAVLLAHKSRLAEASNGDGPRAAGW